MRLGSGGLVALALAAYLACGLWATWPAVRHADEAFLARPAAGHGEAAAGDHLQLAWALWLPGHQLERGAAPWRDPYSFRPVAEAPPNLQGWLLAAPYWPLDRLLGTVRAYNAIVLLGFVLAGGFAAWWLRALGLPRGSALVGGLVFALAPYRVGQSTGHLLGLVAFLLPAMLLALERRRLGWAAAALVAIPLSGQLHLALGAIPLVLGYAWARLPRWEWWRAGAGAAAAVAAGVLVQRTVIEGSIAAGGRSLASVERYSAELSDFVTRGVDAGVEELVFAGWLTPLVAAVGLGSLVAARRAGLAWLLGVAVLVPALLALGTSLPAYEWLWEHLPGFRYPRVPERLLPIACLALAALAAYGASRLRTPLALALLAVALAVDLRVPVFGAVAADEGNAAYAAIEGDGTLLELPVLRPDLHWGSVYLHYARQSPRTRPQGYSTVAPAAADAWARAARGLSCGRGELPPWVRVVALHRGLYAQSGFFAPGCADAAERMLRKRGWRLLDRDGPVSTYARAPA